MPVAKEKFHNELQVTVSEGKLNFIRLIKAAPHNLWTVQNSKDIFGVYEKVLDLKIPFKSLDIEMGETLEFLFVNAKFGTSDVFIPNEMLLSIKRD